MDQEEQLKLSSQVCFPIYSVSRLLTKAYKPHLDQLGITYPQCLVLLVLWENDQITVNQITEKLYLNTNTVSPLLQRIEKLGLIHRSKCSKDERSLIVALTKQGKKLKTEASAIPEKLLQVLLKAPMELQEVIHLKDSLVELIDVLHNKNTTTK